MRPFSSRERDLHRFDLGAYRSIPADDVSPTMRRIMRFRSITTLCLFGAAAFVALKYPMQLEHQPQPLSNMRLTPPQRMAIAKLLILLDIARLLLA
jgi:hypothetical protein